jgi:transketolase
MRNQFAKTLLEVAESDEKLVALLGDISVWLLKDFKEKFPNRIYNLGICEQAMMSAGAGLALNGLIPVLHSITPFITERCYEQIKDDFCYQKLGGNIISVGSAFDYAALGSTHHSYSDIAILRSLPRAQVIYPASPIEFDTLFKQTYNNDKLTYFRLPAKTHQQEFKKEQIVFGKGIKVKEGTDLTVVVTGPQLENVLKCKENIDVIYIHTIKPIDKELIIESAKKTGKVLTVEEHSIIGGLGDEVSRTIETIKDVELQRIGINDKFVRDYGNYEEVCEKLGLTAEAINKKIEEMLK